MRSCQDQFRSLLTRIRRGTTRHQAEIAIARLKRAINRYGKQCDPSEAEFLTLFLEVSFGHRRVPATVDLLKSLVARASPVARLEACQLIARLTLLSEPLDSNLEYRRQALELSSHGYPGEKFVILVHWLSALIKVGEFCRALQMLPDVEAALRELNSAVLQRSEIYEIHSRFFTHKAKIEFWKTWSAEPHEIPSLIRSGMRFYEKALKRDRANDHRRVNGQIEFAEELIRVHRRTKVETLRDAAAILDQAERALDAHVCPGCPAYFLQVRGELALAEGDTAYSHSWLDAVSMWQKSAELLDSSIAAYQKAGYGEVIDPQKLLTETQERIAMANLPRGIFLSHKGVDADLVREFKQVLEELKFEPWLDEASLHAGMPLEDSLLAGFKNSCAAVFFITPSFKESTWLDSEIRYAMAEYRARANQFAIIPLVFQAANGTVGIVPDILQQFVYKKPKNELDALRELIRALPLGPGTPVWRQRGPKASST